MRRVWLAVAIAIGPSTAYADEAFQLGAFFGPRIFSDDSLLGYIDTAPAHPSLTNAIGFGARAARPFAFPWFLPELEFVIVPTKTTTDGGAAAASVVWLEPRVQLRIELMPQRRVEPFVVVGGGAPIALSSARQTFNTGVIGEGYAGAGVRFDTRKGFKLRLDARVSVLPAGAGVLAIEGDVNFGLELALGTRRRSTTERLVGSPTDRDGDGIPDAADRCPDRPEDMDDFEDTDGCPDIDNDLDHVLDIADKCPTSPETMNGYDDDDGCEDSVPADVTALRGTVEGLIYAEGETGVRDSAQAYVRKLAAVMQAHPSIKIVLVGHTDDREAGEFATAVEGQPPPDLDAIASDLSRGRAEALRQALVGAGIPTARIVIDGVGAEEPVADNATTKGRLANRRVELKLYVRR